MLSWHRFRLYACLAVMLLILGAGGLSLLRWGVRRPDIYDTPSGSPFSELQGWNYAYRARHGLLPTQEHVLVESEEIHVNDPPPIE